MIAMFIIAIFVAFIFILNYSFRLPATKKFFMSNLQACYHFKLDFQEVDQHNIVGKWLIHGTKRRKDNQLQCLELPCRIS